MNKKKLIRKIAIPTGVVMSIAIILLILQGPFDRWQYKKHLAEADERVATLTSEIQAEAAEISKKINSLPIDEKMAAELQSKYFAQHQQPNIPKKYLWMIGVDDELLLAAPSAPFEKMDRIYNKYGESIMDAYNLDRNDFFLKLVDKYDEIGSEDLIDPVPPIGPPLFEVPRLPRLRLLGRFFPPDGYYRNPSASVSSPVYGEAGDLIGTLYLKANDRVNEEFYYSLNAFKVAKLYYLQIFNILVPIAFLSGIILWFLLPSWVYIDARQRDMKNPAVWALITLISTVFGLMVYLITRPLQLKEFRCPACQGELNGANAYCPNCGHDLSTAFCSECRYPIKPDWAFCPNCRASLKKDLKEISRSENVEMNTDEGEEKV